MPEGDDFYGSAFRRAQIPFLARQLAIDNYHYYQRAINHLDELKTTANLTAFVQTHSQ